jgi:predicted lipoprotein with Yx(FWY)xxD motif
MKFLVLLVTSILAVSAQAEGISPTSEVALSETQTILADSFGRTLYTFDVDQNGISKCYNKCAEEWPPILIESAEAEALKPPFGIHTRTNGKIQLTMNNKPLYTYYEDRLVKDTLGDGLGGVWHIVTVR